MTDENKLIDQARSAKERAHAPYSKFQVGAAIESEDGQIVSGCNVEISSYGLTVCAERVAIFKAVSEGVRGFKRMAIITDTEEFCPPCGACRQVIWDFAPEIEIVLVNKRGEKQYWNIRDLYPQAFGNNYLHKG